MKLKIVLILLLFSFAIKSQMVSPDYLISLKPQLVGQYERMENVPYIKIAMEFAEDSILNKKALGALYGRTVLRVDLVYSDYKEVKSFDQPELNKGRYLHLLKSAPFLFNNAAIQWNAYSQTGCTSPNMCSNFFHGFYIYFENPPTAAFMVKEMNNIFGILDKRDTVIETISPRISKKCIGYYYEPLLKSKRDAGIKYKERSVWNRKRISIYENYHRTIRKKVKIYDLAKTASGTMSGGYAMYMNDTVILSVLERRKSWKNMVIVQDITGSMSPYSSQVIRWIFLNNNISRVRSFTFFNDGDQKCDGSKKIGSTGGIYFTKERNASEIVESMQDAMTHGGGGDSPENDVEAILKAQEIYPEAEEFILIADNFSNMRDYALISQIKKPVRVILCGSYYGINTQYLDLARITGGSVHTMEEDLEQLGTLNEGETISINKVKYEVRKGRFILVR